MPGVPPLRAQRPRKHKRAQGLQPILLWKVKAFSCQSVWLFGPHQLQPTRLLLSGTDANASSLVLCRIRRKWYIMMCNKESILNYIPAYPNTFVNTLLDISGGVAPWRPTCFSVKIHSEPGSTPSPKCLVDFPLMDFSLPRHHLFLPNLSLYWPFSPTHLPFPSSLKCHQMKFEYIMDWPPERDFVLSWTHLVRSSGSLWFLESRLTAV